MLHHYHTRRNLIRPICRGEILHRKRTQTGGSTPQTLRHLLQTDSLEGSRLVTREGPTGYCEYSDCHLSHRDRSQRSRGHPRRGSHDEFSGFAYKAADSAVVTERNMQGRSAMGWVRGCGVNGSRYDNVLTNYGESAEEEPPERRVSVIMHETGGVLLLGGRWLR